MGHLAGKSWQKHITMRLKVLISLLMVTVSLTLPLPDAEAEARAQDPSMIMLNSMTLLPLLLAGAAFAKGYLFGNIKNLKSSHYGGYGHRLGHPYGYGGQYGYGRRVSVDGAEYTPPGVYGGEYTTSKDNTQLATSDQYEEYSNTNQHNTDYPTTLQALQYSPYQFNNYGYWEACIIGSILWEWFQQKILKRIFLFNTGGNYQTLKKCFCPTFWNLVGDKLKIFFLSLIHQKILQTCFDVMIDIFCCLKMLIAIYDVI